ncbi:EsaB/YukD family protein [Cumulibacter soli]|uniref:EsaB/YukD family protein n=1 Tax=Cumulibacter soli TaxID=2546344 RepID=UPI00106756BF|nr:EsaB/YukD family protein [Cumulibacter soli]
MTIPLTVVGAEQSNDLVLPKHLPLAVLSDDLSEISGLPVTELHTVSGRKLDLSLSLHENGIAAGAIVLVSNPATTLIATDDVADVVQADPRPGSPLDRRGVALTCAVALLIAIGDAQASQPVLAVGCLAAVVGWALLPRLVLRMRGLSAANDPTDGRVRDRVVAAHTLTGWGGRVLAVVVLAMAVALTMHVDPAAVITGWLMLVWACLRSTGNDPILALPMLAAVAIATATGLAVVFDSEGVVIPAIATSLGTMMSGWALAPNVSRPFTRVLREQALRIATVLTPAGLLLASGLLPLP